MKTSNRDHRFQNLNRTINFSKSEKQFIESLKPFQGGEWDKSFTGTGRLRGTGTKRDALKNSIGLKLRNIQYPHCIYCGFHDSIVGNLQREHIAPKDIHYNFVFESHNLALACANCNGFIKKHTFDSVSKSNSNYKNCTFKIVHPYLDKFQDHLEFVLKNNDLFIKAKKYSRKGKQTISLFGLADVRQTSLRGAAIIKKHIKLTSAQEALVQAAIKKEYNTI